MGFTGDSILQGSFCIPFRSYVVVLILSSTFACSAWGVPPCYGLIIIYLGVDIKTEYCTNI